MTRHQRLTIHAGFDAVASGSEAESSPGGLAPDLEAAAAVATPESLPSLSGLNAARFWDQQPDAASVQGFVDISVLQNPLAPPLDGVAQRYDQPLMGLQMFDQGKLTAVPLVGSSKQSS